MGFLDTISEAGIDAPTGAAICSHRSRQTGRKWNACQRLKESHQRIERIPLQPPLFRQLGQPQQKKCGTQLVVTTRPCFVEGRPVCFGNYFTGRRVR